ncbi:MAG: PAS domain S-box protein [Thermoguttaceae bacterium]
MSYLLQDPPSEAAANRPSPRPAGKAIDLDGGALDRQMALLNIVRRTNAQPPIAVLVEDTAKLVASGVRAEVALWGQVVPGDQCRLNLARFDGAGKASQSTTGAFALSDATLGAHALRMGQVVTVERFGSKDPMPELLLRREKVMSGVTVPFHVNGKPAGLIGVYSDHPRKWSHDEVVFVETAAHLLVAYSARLLAEEQLEAERRARTDFMSSVNAIVVTLDPQGRIVELNEPGQRLTGYTLEEVRGAPFCSKLVPPGEVELVEGILRGCQDDSFTNEYAGWMMRKDGSQLRVAWTLKVLHNGQIQSMVLVGIDRTDQFLATAKLRRMTTVARNALGALCTSQQRQVEPLAAGGGNGPDPAFNTDPIAKPDGLLAPLTNRPVGEKRPGLPGEIRAGNLNLPFPDRRASPRHPYPYRQSIAPVVDGRMPAANEFVPVECRDISSIGVAFYFDRVPEFKELVLALGYAPRVTKVVCRVVRVARMEHNGQIRYLVGCRFIGRSKG